MVKTGEKQCEECDQTVHGNMSTHTNVDYLLPFISTKSFGSKFLYCNHCVSLSTI